MFTKVERTRRSADTLLFGIGALVVACLVCGSVMAAEDPPIGGDIEQVKSTPVVPALIVATKQSPPFAIKNADGSWTGISLDLWRHLSDELDLEYVLVEQTLDQMLASLEAGQIDAAVAAISVTAERHGRVEFCHPHFATGLGVAVSTRNRANPWSLVRRVVSARLLMIVSAMIGVVAICGLLFWSFERKHNATMFGGKRRQGIGMGAWWSIVLLLGHKGVIPVSVWGRVLATCAMLSSIMLLSILTGVIASVLTVQQLDAGISHPSDLRHVRIATVTSSTSAEYLRQRRISFRGFSALSDALQAVDDGKADAVVYDQALLKYFANGEFATRVEVLPMSFNLQEYAIALRQDSPLRRPLNEALLEYRASDAWDDLMYRYLGD